MSLETKRTKNVVKLKVATATTASFDTGGNATFVIEVPAASTADSVKVQGMNGASVDAGSNDADATWTDIVTLAAGSGIYRVPTAAELIGIQAFKKIRIVLGSSASNTLFVYLHCSS